jgi:hypothetical protein
MLPGHKRVLRCRLKAQWSLAATIFFWMVFAFQLLLIGLFATREPWLWMALLSMPLLSWYWEEEKHDLEAMVGQFLDAMAEEKKLIKVSAEDVKAGESALVPEP